MTKYCQGKDKAFQYQLWYIINGTAVPANWYWSISQLVLEYQLIGTGVSANWYVVIINCLCDIRNASFRQPLGLKFIQLTVQGLI